MPCYDELNSSSFIHNNTVRPLERKVCELEDKNKKLEAVLCGFIRGYQSRYKGILPSFIDWDEVGVSQKWVKDWWSNHKKEDRKRARKSHLNWYDDKG